MRNLRGGDTVRFIQQHVYLNTAGRAGDIGLVRQVCGGPPEAPWKRLYVVLILRTGEQGLVWHDVRDTQHNSLERVSDLTFV